MTHLENSERPAAPHDANQYNAAQALAHEAQHSTLLKGSAAGGAGDSEQSLQKSLDGGLKSTADLYKSTEQKSFLPYKEPDKTPPEKPDPDLRRKTPEDERHLPRDTQASPKPPIIHY